MGMTDRNSTVFLQQQQCHRFAHHVAAAQHHRMLSVQWNLIIFQHRHTSPWRAGGPAALPHQQGAAVGRAQAVHVLFRSQSRTDRVPVHLFRHGHHGQDAGDVRIFVQFPDCRNGFFRSSCFRQFHTTAADAQAFRNFQQPLPVHKGCGVLAHGQNGQRDFLSGFLRCFHFFFDLFFIGIRHRAAAHHQCFHMHFLFDSKRPTGTSVGLDLI